MDHSVYTHDDDNLDEYTEELKSYPKVLPRHMNTMNG